MMDHNRTLAEGMLGYWIDFIHYAGKMTLLVATFSSLTGAVLWVLYPPAFPFFFITVISLGGHIGGMYVRDKRKDGKGRNSPEFDPKAKLKVAVAYTIYFTPLVFVTSFFSGIMNAKFGHSLIWIIISIWYPVLDFYSLWHRNKSLGSYAFEVTVNISHLAGFETDISTDLLISGLNDNPISYVFFKLYEQFR